MRSSGHRRTSDPSGSQSDRGWNCSLSADITIRDLSADEVSGDKTDERKREIDEGGIVVTPHIAVERTRTMENVPKAEKA